MSSSFAGISLDVQRIAWARTVTLATGGGWAFDFTQGVDTNADGTFDEAGSLDPIEDLTVLVPTGASAAVRLAFLAPAKSGNFYVDIPAGDKFVVPGTVTQFSLENLDGSSPVIVGMMGSWVRAASRNPTAMPVFTKAGGQNWIET